MAVEALINFLKIFVGSRYYTVDKPTRMFLYYHLHSTLTFRLPPNIS